MDRNILVLILLYFCILATRSHPLKEAHGREKRTVLLFKTKLWSNVIPYVISNELAEDEYILKKILEAIESFEAKTCLEFQRHYEQNVSLHNSISIVKAERRCKSDFRPPNPKLSLMESCAHKSVIIHQLMHALGFLHEHARSDRDEYIDIIYDNLRRGAKRYLRIAEKFKVLGPYDPKSILHCSSRSFSKNGKDTVQWKKDHTMKLGNTDLSELDVQKLNFYYCGVSFKRTATVTTATVDPMTTTSELLKEECVDRKSHCWIVAKEPDELCAKFEKHCPRTCGGC